MSATLCQRLLYTSFGEEVGAVGAILLERGRLNIRQLCNLLPHLSLTQIAKCLGVLLQQNCIFHSNIANAESRASSDQIRVDFFEASERDILDRLRFGHVRALHRSAHRLKHDAIPESIALSLIEMLTLHGKMRLGALLNQMEADIAHTQISNQRDQPSDGGGRSRKKVKGKADVPNYSRLDCLECVRLLLRKRYLRVVTARQMMSDADRGLKQEREILSKAREAHGRMPSSQQLKKIRAEVLATGANDHIAKEDSDEEYEAAIVGEKRKLEGPANGHVPSPKRFRADLQLNENCILRINVDRYMLINRDAIIAKAVLARYGPYFRDVVDAVLLVAAQGVEDHVRGGEYLSRSVSTAEIATQMAQTCPSPKRSHRPAFVDRCSSSRVSGDRSGVWTRDDSDEFALIREACEIMSGDHPDDSIDDDGEDGSRASLQSPQRPWMHRVASLTASLSGQERWRIDFNAVADSIKHALLEDLVMRRFGSRGRVACRLVNLLTVKGHTDEKQLAKIALLPAKEVRSLLSELTTQRLLESQEVSRSKTDRSRSIFYYYVDPSSWQKMLLSEVYQALCNLWSRASTELAAQDALLARLYRGDVAGETSKLSDADQQSLGRLNVKLDLLWAAIARADEDRYILEMYE